MDTPISFSSKLFNETLITLCEVSKKLPPGRGGRPVSFSCVLRWITHGIPGPDGKRAKLEGVRVGGRWLTSVEAIARWADLLTPRDGSLAPIPRTPTQKRKASEQAERQLDEAGIK